MANGGNQKVSGRQAPEEDSASLQHKQLVHLDEINKTQSWYDADVQPRLRRLTLELVSERTTYISMVFNALVTALAEGKRTQDMESRDPWGETILLAGTRWESRAHVKTRCQEILRTYETGEPVEEPDLSFMKALLEHHPRGQQKLAGCQGMIVGVHPMYKARCFYIVRDGGSEDFSYVRCVDNTPTEEVSLQQSICDALVSMLKLHPGCCEQVAKIIEENVPSYHGREGASVETHRNWTKSILVLCAKMPGLTEFLLSVLVRRMCQIDVAIQRMEESAPEDDLGAGEADGEEPAVDGEDMQETAAERERVQTEIDSMAHILDAQMMMMFEFVQHHLAGDVGEAENRLASCLLSIFESTVLPTHQARCVQFLWFYLASLRPAWTEAFLSFLLHTAFSGTQAIPKRLTALAYLASFVARATFLTKNFVLRTAQYIATLARENQQMAETHNSIGDVQHPQLLLFLYAVQAVCYMMCWHMEELAVVEDHQNQSGLHALMHEGNAEAGVEVLPFWPALESGINPIALINRQVALQFLSCLSKHNSGLVATLRQRLREPSAAMHFTQGEQAGLDLFFPFDPYRLRHSSMFILSIYRLWEGGGDDDESQADPNESGFAKSTALPPSARHHCRSSAASDVDSEARSDVDFTDAKDAVERGFAPSIGPSPAFRPRGSTDVVDIMSPLCMPMESVVNDEEEDGGMLPIASVPLDDGVGGPLFMFMNSAAYQQGKVIDPTAKVHG